MPARKKKESPTALYSTIFSWISYIYLNSPSMDEESVIEALQDAFPESLDLEILSKWQLELEPHEIDIVFLQLTPRSSSETHISRVLQMLQDLAPEVHSDFKVIILDILNVFASACYENRKKFAQSADILVKAALDARLEAKSPTDSVYQSYLKLLSTILPLNCSPQNLLQLVHPFFTYPLSFDCQLYDSLKHLFAEQHFPFQIYSTKAPLAIPIACFRNKQLTAQFWINIDEDLQIFTLASSSKFETTLSIYVLNQQMIVSLNQEGKSTKYTFNQNFQGLVHFALTYDSYKNLSLFVNGDYSESIPCAEIHRVIHTWDKLYLGGQNENTIHDQASPVELVLGQFTLLSTAIAPEWVSFIYNLGSNYLWDFKELTEQNINSHLSQLTYSASSKFFSHCRDNFGTTEAPKIISQLTASRIKQSQIVFDSLSLPIFTPKTPQQALFSIGGSALLLRLIELHGSNKALDLLLMILNDDWRLAREFEMIHGYSILQILLAKEKKEGKGTSSLSILLTNCGYSLDDPSNSKIINPHLYQIILNYDLFGNDQLLKDNFKNLLRGRYQLENTAILQSLNIVNKLIQHLKAKNSEIGLLETILQCDPTIESIKNVSYFIIFSLYGKENLGKLGSEAAIALMEALASKEPKKLKKSLTIHWILLLISYQNDAIISMKALKFLSKLLWDLGQKTAQKFFDNYGVDVLIHFLGDWWKEATILKAVYQAAFFEDRLVMPQFLNILNGLASNAITSKTQSRLNSPRSLDADTDVALKQTVYASLFEYKELIRVAFTNTSKNKFFITKDFLDSYFYVLSKLQYLSEDAQFKTVLTQLLEIISHAFIELINDYLTFISIFNQLSEFTKKLIFHMVFPIIFNHIIQFAPIIQKDDQFLEYSAKLIRLYLSEFLNAGYYIGKNLDLFIKCTLTVLDNCQNNFKIKGIGNWIIKWSATGNFKDCLTELLYRSMVILDSDIVSDSQLLDLIIVLLGRYIETNGPEESLFNFLRTCCLSRFNKLPKLAAVKYPTSDLDDFFKVLTTRNDDETTRYVVKHNELCVIATKTFHNVINTVSPLSITQMISSMIDAHQTIPGSVQTFIKDCDQLKAHIVNGEIVKFNRMAQDQLESNKYCLSLYSSLKAENLRLLSPQEYESKAHYISDFIEGTDRMRSRMVMEDQLAEEEKLAYNINIPTRYEEDENAKCITAPILAQTIDEDEDETFELIETEQVEDKNRKVLRSLFQGDHIVSLWNVSQINGLVPIESLLIMGKSYLYLLENYFHTDGGVVDVTDAPQALRDPYLQLINNSHIQREGHRRKAWNLDILGCVSKRQFLLRDVAIEMFFLDGASILITCLNTRERDSLFNTLNSLAKGGIDTDLSVTLSSKENGFNMLTQGFAAKMASLATGSTSTLETITLKWRMGKISNFYYLILINTLAGRTFNDLTQYPIFPWVLSDYTSENLDLTDPRSYRDLSKPMGAQTSARAEQFKERFMALEGDTDNPPFHYGTHYSSAMIVTSYLVRLEPFVQSYLLLQGGRFDHADRLFNSISRTWELASKDSTTDVRELIPEFFYLPEFLVNSSKFELGKSAHTGKLTDDVVLPPWAKGDPVIFVAKHREALESPIVSKNLHLWIDLIFGYKQQGQEAIKALNVFHHLSYSGAIDVDSIEDEREKRAVIGTINNFGQTPIKVFNKPHPQREVLNDVVLYMNFPEFQPTRVKQPEKPELTIKEIGVNKSSLVVNSKIFWNIHPSKINCTLYINNRTLLLGYEDGTISAWKFQHDSSLDLVGVLRGHHSGVKRLCSSDNFHIAASIDEEGKMILWDIARFKFIRTVSTNRAEFCAISSTTGYLFVIFNNDTVKIFTINAELLCKSKINRKHITAICFSDPSKDSKSQHAYWGTELIGISYGGAVPHIDIYELKQNWNLQKVKTWPLVGSPIGSPVDLEIKKMVDIDNEDKLARGKIKVIVKDDKGKVFTW